MRIFSAARHSLDGAFYSGDLWSSHFHPALRALGHEVVESQVDLLPASRFMHIAENFTPQERELRSSITDRIVQEVRRAHAERPVDLFLSYFYNAHFDPPGFDAIHRLDIPTVNFYCNSIYQFEHVAAIAQKAAYSWHAEKDAAARYRRVGATPIWIQMAADPNVCRPVPGAVRRPAACFVGQRYADRDRLMALVLRAGVPLTIYGAGWSAEPRERGNGHRPARYLGRRPLVPGSMRSYAAAFTGNMATDGVIAGLRRSWRQMRDRRETRTLLQELQPAFAGRARDLSETYAGFELVLNASNVWSDGRPGSALVSHVRLRDFEAPMCRACYLTGHTEEISEFFEPDREIATYRTAEELVDKARFYLSHPADAERLREAGYRRARRDHTWERRFEQLFRTIGVE